MNVLIKLLVMLYYRSMTSGIGTWTSLIHNHPKAGEAAVIISLDLGKYYCIFSVHIGNRTLEARTMLYFNTLG